MKKIFTVMLALALCISVSACGRTDHERSEEQTESLANEMQQDSLANESEGSEEEPAPGADDGETQTQEDAAQKEPQDGGDAAQDEQPAGEGSGGQAFDLGAWTVMLTPHARPLGTTINETVGGDRVLNLFLPLSILYLTAKIVFILGL